MSGVLKVLLLVALALVYTQAWDNYRHLPDDWKTHIGKALKEANLKFGKEYHINFHELLSTSRLTKRFVRVNVRLKVTTCKQDEGRAYDHWDECKERKMNTPQIDCLVCTQDNDEELVDCAIRREVENKKRDDIRNKCHGYMAGGSTLFSKSGDSEKQYGCLGCI